MQSHQWRVRWDGHLVELHCRWLADDARAKAEFKLFVDRKCLAQRTFSRPGWRYDLRQDAPMVIRATWRDRQQQLKQIKSEVLWFQRACPSMPPLACQIHALCKPRDMFHECIFDDSAMDMLPW